MKLAYWLDSARYYVLQASKGSRAIQMLQACIFQRVLSDIVMDDVTGLDVLQAAQNLQDPPVVVLMAGYGAVPTAIHALQKGVGDYTLKRVFAISLQVSAKPAIILPRS